MLLTIQELKQKNDLLAEKSLSAILGFFQSTEEIDRNLLDYKVKENFNNLVDYLVTSAVPIELYLETLENGVYSSLNTYIEELLMNGGDNTMLAGAKIHVLLSKKAGIIRLWLKEVELNQNVFLNTAERTKQLIRTIKIENLVDGLRPDAVNHEAKKIFVKDLVLLEKRLRKCGLASLNTPSIIALSECLENPTKIPSRIL